jgi:hypothetical protein
MKFTLPFSKTTAGTVVFANQLDKSLPVNAIYVRKGTIVDGKDVSQLKSLTFTLSAEGNG